MRDVTQHVGARRVQDGSPDRTEKRFLARCLPSDGSPAHVRNEQRVTGLGTTLPHLKLIVDFTARITKVLFVTLNKKEVGLVRGACLRFYTEEGVPEVAYARYIQTTGTAKRSQAID